MAEHHPLLIRPMAAGDAGDVARLCGQLGYPAAPEQVAARFTPIVAMGDSEVAVAEAEGRVVAWIHVAMLRTIESDVMAEILGLVVDEAMRGRGVGGLMIREAERWAAEAGCAAVRVRSRVVRERAHAFYERAGYRRLKTQHVFEKPLAPVARPPLR